MSDVGDLPALTFGNCVMRINDRGWLSGFRNYTRTFLNVLTFFNIQKHKVLHFGVLARFFEHCGPCSRPVMQHGCHFVHVSWRPSSPVNAGIFYRPWTRDVKTARVHGWCRQAPVDTARVGAVLKKTLSAVLFASMARWHGCFVLTGALTSRQRSTWTP